MLALAPLLLALGTPLRSSLLPGGLERWGPETGKTLVVVGGDADVSERDLIDYCREKIAHYKCPTSVEFRQELARTATGKLQKFKLRAPYWEGVEKGIN